MVTDDKKHDPLDPLEAAYEESTGEALSPGQQQGAAPEIPSVDSDIFHGEPVSEDISLQTEDLNSKPYSAPDAELASPPPPPPISPIQRVFKILPFIAGLLFLIGLGIFGYKFITKKDQGAKELVYWVLWEEEEVVRPLVEEYEKKHSGVKIKYVRQTPLQYRERLKAHIARGEGPDIFRFHNTWVPMLREELAPLPEQVMKKEEFKEIFYPIMASDLRVGEDIVGIPIMYEGLMVFYNPDLLNSVGIDKPAETWDDFLVQAEQLTVKDQSGTIITAGAAAGRADNIEHFSDVLGLLILQNGGNPARPNSEAGVGALSFYRLFAQQPDNVWSDGFDNDIVAFATGKVAMIFAPSWEVFTVKAINPDFDFRTAPVPQVSGGALQVSWASYWVEGVNSRSPVQKKAWEFLKYLSEKETLEKFFELSAKTRIFGEAYPRQDMKDSLSTHPYLKALVSQAQIAKSFYMASRTFDNGLNDRIIQYYKDAVNSLDEGNSPQAALETAERGVGEVLATFNIRIE